MPFISESQRKWMFANRPDTAKEWAKHTPKDAKLPEKVKQAYAIYASAMEELAKIAATVLQQPLSPEQQARWQAYQAASGPAPSQATVQAMRPVQQQTQHIMSDLPLVGGHGEYYEESLPKHLQGGPNLGVTEAHQQAARQAASNRENILTQRLQATGRVSQSPAGTAQRLAAMTPVNKPGTPVQIRQSGQTQATVSTKGSRPVAVPTSTATHAQVPAGSGFRVSTGSLAGHEATQAAKIHTPEALAPTHVGSLAKPVTQVTRLSKPLATTPKVGVLGKLKGVGGKLLKAAA